MKIFESLDEYLRGKINECFRCGLDLSHVEVKYRTNPELKCPRCGLIVEVASTSNRLKTLAISMSILAGMLAFIVGTVI